MKGTCVVFHVCSNVTRSNTTIEITYESPFSQEAEVEGPDKDLKFSFHFHTPHVLSISTFTPIKLLVLSSNKQSC